VDRAGDARLYEKLVAEGDRKAIQGKMEEALAQYRKALEINPGQDKVRRNVINILIRIGDIGGAIEEYVTWICACQEEERHDDALQLCQEVLNLDTAAAKKSFMLSSKNLLADEIKNRVNEAKGEIYFQIGNILQQRGLADEALQYLKVAVDFMPYDIRVHSALGQAYMRKSMDREAVGEFQECVRLEPGQAGYAYEMLGELYLRSGRAPSTVVVWFRNAGELYERNSQLPFAIRAYKRIQDLDASNEESLERLAELSAEAGEREEALEYSYQLALRYEEKGHFDKALPHYEKIVAEAPEFTEVTAKVIGHYRQFLESDSRNVSMRYKLIGLLLNSGRIEEAVRELIAQASYYLDKGANEEAAIICENILEYDPQNNEAMGIKSVAERRMGAQ
jgi:tetratricopeptide (TPR) repeat protein